MKVRTEQVGKERHAVGGLTRRSFLKGVGGAAGLALVPSLLASCSGFINSGESEQGAVSGTIRMVQEPHQRTSIAELVERFEKENSDITVDVSYLGIDGILNTTRTELASGTAPDIFVVWPATNNSMGASPLGNAGLLADLSDRPWADQIPDLYVREFAYGDQSLGALPPLRGWIGVMYNVKVFEDLGLSIPATWSEFEQTCEEIKQTDKVPVILGTQTSFVNVLIPYALTARTVYAENPDFDAQVVAGEASFGESGWREAIEKYVGMAKKGYFNENPNGTTFEQMNQSVATGDAAMMVNVHAALNQARSYEGAGDVRAFPLPNADRPEDVIQPTSSGTGFGINAATDKLESALAFVDFLGQPEICSLYGEAAGGLPMIPTEDYATPEPIRLVAELLDANRAALYPNVPSPEAQQELMSTLQSVVVGDLTVEDLLNRATDAWREG